VVSDFLMKVHTAVGLKGRKYTGTLFFQSLLYFYNCQIKAICLLVFG